MSSAAASPNTGSVVASRYRFHHRYKYTAASLASRACWWHQSASKSVAGSLRAALTATRQLPTLNDDHADAARGPAIGRPLTVAVHDAHHTLPPRPSHPVAPRSLALLSFAGCRDAGGAGTKRPAAMDDGRADEDGPRPAAKKRRRESVLIAPLGFDRPAYPMPEADGMVSECRN